ncbi:uncharacterized protein LOC119995947 [Tripterygium wilfordii]|nr:uncharacterized protein LOC119995947 [Tripterygium wilfordii]
MCGSLHHLIRDCPSASSFPVMCQTGAMPNYMYPYWNGTWFPHIPPFMYAYSPEMMASSNSFVLPPLGFAHPAYMASIFGSLPPYGGEYMRMGGEIAPVKNSMEHHPCRSEFLDLQDFQRRKKFSDDKGRKQDFVGDPNNDFCGRTDSASIRLPSTKGKDVKRKKNRFDVKGRCKEHQSYSESSTR